MNERNWRLLLRLPRVHRGRHRHRHRCWRRRSLHGRCRLHHGNCWHGRPLDHGHSQELLHIGQRRPCRHVIAWSARAVQAGCRRLALLPSPLLPWRQRQHRPLQLLLGSSCACQRHGGALHCGRLGAPRQRRAGAVEPRRHVRRWSTVASSNHGRRHRRRGSASVGRQHGGHGGGERRWWLCAQAHPTSVNRLQRPRPQRRRRRGAALARLHPTWRQRLLVVQSRRGWGHWQHLCSSSSSLRHGRFSSQRWRRCCATYCRCWPQQLMSGWLVAGGGRLAALSPSGKEDVQGGRRTPLQRQGIFPFA